MPDLLNLQTNRPLMTFSTRGGRVQADGDGIVYEVVAGSPEMADLVSQGAYVVPPPAASDPDLPD